MKKVATWIGKFLDTLFPGVDWKNIPTATYVRYVLMVISTINTILATSGMAPIEVDDQAVYTIVSIIVNIVILLVNTYKNNSTSKEALFADHIMRVLKDVDTVTGTTLMEDIQVLLNEATKNEQETADQKLVETILDLDKKFEEEKKAMEEEEKTDLDPDRTDIKDVQAIVDDIDITAEPEEPEEDSEEETEEESSKEDEEEVPDEEPVEEEEE